MILIYFLQVSKGFEMFKNIFVYTQESLTGHVVLACSGNSGASRTAIHHGRLHSLNGTSQSPKVFLGYCPLGCCVSFHVNYLVHVVGSAESFFI